MDVGYYRSLVIFLENKEPVDIGDDCVRVVGGVDYRCDISHLAVARALITALFVVEI